MDRLDLKVEFEKQVKDADVKIAEAEKNLIQLKEYKTKLLGGLETLELLNSEDNNTNPNEDSADAGAQGTAAGVPTITDVPPVDPPSTDS